LPICHLWRHDLPKHISRSLASPGTAMKNLRASQWKLASTWLTAFAIASAFLYYFLVKTAANFSSTPPDMLIFFQHGTGFLTTQQLYDHPKPDLPIATIYQPSSSAYKFPPAFQLLLLPLSLGIENNIPEETLGYTKEEILNYTLHLPETYQGIRIGIIMLYFLSAYLFYRAVKKSEIAMTSKKEAIIALLYLFFVISNDSYFEQLQYANIEALLLFFLAVSATTLATRPVISGIMTGLAAAIKVYPVFILSYFLLSCRTRSVTGCLAGAFLLTLAGWLTFGQQENAFYFTRVLPLVIREPLFTASYNISLANLLASLGPLFGNSSGLFNLVRILSLGLTALLIYRHKDQQGDQLHILSLTILCMLICMQNYWSAYLVMTLLPVTLILRSLAAEISLLKIFVVATVFLLLFTDFDWCLEIQLLHEISGNPDALGEFWSGKSYGESHIKQWIYLWPLAQTLIYWCNHMKGAVPLMMWIWLVCTLQSRHHHTINIAGAQ
jgi:hypothetical protein